MPTLQNEAERQTNKSEQTNDNIPIQPDTKNAFKKEKKLK